jgi:hypothetical protein
MARAAKNSRRAAAEALISATLAVAEAGKPLMLRVVPADGDFLAWDHYPAEDAVDARSGARWFYHAHGPGERDAGEHGHFHLFLDRKSFSDVRLEPLAGPPGGASSGADIVHLIAIAIDLDGLPTRIFTVNRWVTDEWLYAAGEIQEKLGSFDLSSATGDASGERLAYRRGSRSSGPEIETALQLRDAEIARWQRRMIPSRTAAAKSCLPCRSTSTQRLPPQAEHRNNV